MPSLVECHTHLVFGGNCAHEFERKLRGESYWLGENPVRNVIIGGL